MKINRALCFVFICTLAISCDKKNIDCEGESYPYWANGNDTRIEGESKKIREIFSDIQQNEVLIAPEVGFITLRLNINKNGNVCNLESFQTNENYESIEFNNGELIKKLENKAMNISGWKSELNVKSYYLIRLTIVDGKIREIF